MAKKKEPIDEFQITMEELDREKIKIYETTKINAEIVTKKDSKPEILDTVKKNNTNLLNEVINITAEEGGFEDNFLMEIDDLTDLNIPITNKISLSHSSPKIEKLTNFDKEVMDAVATLAPISNVISASTIFRLISGKINGVVNKEQREKVNDSMERCKKYEIEIDLTSEYLEFSPKEKGSVEGVKYTGFLIYFSTINKMTKNGSNYYYKIMDMPTMFRWAESIGKVSTFPLILLDTPIQKTEAVIVVQGFLLREIDNMKKMVRESNFICWEQIYEVTNFTNFTRQKKLRMRDYVKVILQDWKEKGFIEDFSISNNHEQKGIFIN